MQICYVYGVTIPYRVYFRNLTPTSTSRHFYILQFKPLQSGNLSKILNVGIYIYYFDAFQDKNLNNRNGKHFQVPTLPVEKKPSILIPSHY